MNEKAKQLVADLVREILPSIPNTLDPSQLPNAVHAAVWPLLRDAVENVVGELPLPESTDKRAKKWQYVAYFWRLTSIGPDLEGETDPVVINGTGGLAQHLPRLAAQLHECPVSHLPAEIREDGIKAMLPQLRNNLGRSERGAGVLRITYDHGGTPYLCQVDVVRVSE